MADVCEAIRFGELAVGPGLLVAALTQAAKGARPVLLRWPGAQISPFAADFVEAALSAIGDDPRVAGVSLALPRLRPGTAMPFVPLEDGFDAFFLQYAPLAALVMTPAQAARATAGLAHHNGNLVDWLSACGSTFLAPRTALAHDGRDTGDQKRMFPVGPRAWRIGSPDESLAMYDARLELTGEAARRLAPVLAEFEFTVDLWGERPPREIPKTLLLSARSCRMAMLRFPLEFVPPEANLAAPREQGFFALGRSEDFEPMEQSRRERLFRHATRYNAMDDYAAQFLGPLRRLRQRAMA